MISRASRVGVALWAMLAASPCLAQEATAPATQAAPTTSGGATPGRGGVGGLLGASSIYMAEDYSKGALPRFDFAGQFRYVMSRSFRLQISPGLTWAAYSKTEPPPFTDIKNPGDLTKERYLTLLVPVSTQLQLTFGRSPWHYHLGAGPGVYRVWVENHRKVLVDPQTFRLHRGTYLGFSAEMGVERFLKALPNTSVEVSAVHHYVMATRDDQFPTGWNSSLGAVALRVGTNYYFDLKRPKKEELPLGGQ
jgi:hypothetical protein